MTEAIIYIVFRSVHDAMKTEAALKAAGFAVDAVPAPREIRPDCGLALRLSREEQHEVMEYLERQNLAYAEIVHLPQEGKKR